MALHYRGTLTHLRATDVEVRLESFGIQEGYSTGWSGTGVIVGDNGDSPLSAGQMLSAVMASGVLAGIPMGLNLEIDGGTLDGTNVRSWPCVVSGLSPYAVDETSAACNVQLVDPISYLAEQPVWGAYRGVSAAEAVGGVLSMAAGGDGKPATAPILPFLAPVRIVAEYRDALARVPYVIAAGQTLGDWLADFLATLGLRAELRGYSDGRLSVTLTDAKPHRTALEMSITTPQGSDPPSSDTMGPIMIQGHSAFPGVPLRGGLLDDPTKGSARPLWKFGPVGAVMTDSEVDVDEATGRLFQAARGTLTEMFMLTALSRQPRFQPGETIRLSRPTHGLTDWQVSSVSHWLQSAVYDNDATLIRGDMAWHPDLPLYRPPVYVSAVVDGGDDYDFHQPVPRDRLGRIKVVFPFTPTPVGDEARDLAAADTNDDWTVTLADFDEDQIKTFTQDTAEWERERAKYDAGDYNDPYPGKTDDQLTAAEKERRKELFEKRKNAVAYGAYQKAVAFDQRDADADGVLSARDELISDELREALREEEARLQEAWENRDETPLEEGSLAEQYGELFGDETEGLSDEILAARADAEEMADRWPPRIPLPVVKPMAGALHGFIVAHRHGDTCRVAVHNPFSAEIVGFQYRNDRKINADLTGSVAGLVVEHNYADAWSGLVFRRTEDMENNAEQGTADETADAEEETANETEGTEKETEKETGETEKTSTASGNVPQQRQEWNRLGQDDLRRRRGSRPLPTGSRPPQGTPPPSGGTPPPGTPPPGTPPPGTPPPGTPPTGGTPPPSTPPSGTPPPSTPSGTPPPSTRPPGTLPQGNPPPDA